MTGFVTQRNGELANTDELSPLAFAGYAHFTAMQVRGGHVRGLDLHLERLRIASMNLFGQALPPERIRSYLRSALAGGPPDVSLTATIYSPAGEFAVAGDEVVPEVLIRTSPAASGPRGPLALWTVNHERVLPAIKHVGEVAKTYYLREAVARGYDDAAFVDQQGRISEASIWNLAFWDGTSVVWPAAEMLGGTTMGIVRRQLDRLGIPQRDEEIALTDVSRFVGAVVMNSWTPGVPVKQLGQVQFSTDSRFLTALHQAFENEPLVSP